MRVLVLGAGGFIGRHIIAELLAAGHAVVGVARRIDDLVAAFPAAAFVARDLRRCVAPDHWRALLDGTDVVVDAAGLLRGRDMWAIHVDMPAALASAAVTTGTRVVLISAISAREDVASDYAATKLTGERVLAASGAEWTILRPSLVYGDGSYGGTSLLRGLAALPWAVPLPGDGGFAFSPIHARDLARAVRVVCEDAAFVRRTLEPAGPDDMTLKQLLAAYRGWLGFGRARFVAVPLPVMRGLARLGDLAGDGPVSTNSLVQLIAGNAGDGAAFAREIGFAPRRLADAMVTHPAQVQDRWHARLFFLAPALRAILVLLWLASAVLGLTRGVEQAARVVQGLGLPTAWAEPLRIGSSLLDFALAALVWRDRRARWSTPAQLMTVIGYTLAIGIAWPALWLDPLGPLLKNLPILLTILAFGAIADRR